MNNNNDYRFLIIRQLLKDKDVYEVFDNTKSNVIYMTDKQKNNLKRHVRYANVFRCNKNDIDDISKLNIRKINNIRFQTIDEKDLILFEVTGVYEKVIKDRGNFLVIYKSANDELVFASNCDIISLPDSIKSFMNDNKVYTKRIVLDENVLVNYKYQNITDSILTDFEENKITLK